MGYRPSKKSIKRAVDNIHALTERTSTWQDATVLVAKINRALRSWANYFSVGTTSKAYRAIDSYTVTRTRRWLRIKHRGRQHRARTYPDAHFYETLGLVRLTDRERDKPWAKA